MTDAGNQFFPVNATVYWCPLHDAGCSWRHVESNIPMESDFDRALRRPEDLIRSALRQRAARIEAAAAAHVGTHSPAEWMQEIQRLKTRLAVLEGVLLVGAETGD